MTQAFLFPEREMLYRSTIMTLFDEGINMLFKNSMLRSCFAVSALLLTLTFLTGCTGEKKPDGFPPVYPTTIIVTQEGQPLAEATVLLCAESEALQKWSVAGQTDATGAANVITYGKFPGAPAGDFTVVVTKDVTEKFGEAKMVGGEMSQPPMKIYSVVDTIQTDQKTATNKVKVEKGKNEFKIDVGKKVKVLTGDTTKPV